jgi:hypothetical protein
MKPSLLNNKNAAKHFPPAEIGSDNFVKKLHNRKSNFICEQCIQHNGLFFDICDIKEKEWCNENTLCFCCGGVKCETFRRMNHIRHYDYFRQLDNDLILKESKTMPRYEEV